MALLDYHGKNLLPSVWSPDGDLTQRFLAQLQEQLKRFPETRTVLLVGDAVSHYWQYDSDVDVLILTDDEDMAEVRQNAKRISGFPLAETDNHANFWPVRTSFSPDVLAKHFGPVYNVSTGTWHGRHVQNEMELQRVAGVLQYANWRLWKAKYQDEPFPYDWRILAEAFQVLDNEDRTDVIDAVKYRVAQIDRNVTRLLKRQPKDIWKAAEAFDSELFETEDLPTNGGLVPKRVALALLHRFRYQDLLDTMVEIDEKLMHRARYAARKTLETPNIKSLITRFFQLTETILQQLGGSTHADDYVFQLFEHILDNSRYIQTDMRRRRIVYRLYQQYYMGRGQKEKGKK